MPTLPWRSRVRADCFIVTLRVKPLFDQWRPTGSITALASLPIDQIGQPQRDLRKTDAHMRMLLRLGLSRTRITDVGLKHLLGMTDLRSLVLSDTAITDEGLRIIGQLRSLRHLVLRDTQITDAGLAHLMGLVNLESISFRAPSPPRTGQLTVCSTWET